MRFITAVTTCGRPDYLVMALRSWVNTRNPKHEHRLLIVDDGSEQSHLYAGLLAAYGGPYTLISSDRQRGIHHSANQIIRFLVHEKFDVCFRMDDDIIFKKPGWDDKYAEAIQKTGRGHFVHHDPRWHRAFQPPRETMGHMSGLIDSRCFWWCAQGAFYTITPELVSVVGFFDVENFGLCGGGHQDYTARCQKYLERVGSSAWHDTWDIVNSNDYLALQLDGYHSAPGREEYWPLWNDDKKREKINACYAQLGRIYVPYRQLDVDVFGKPI